MRTRSLGAAAILAAVCLLAAGCGIGTGTGASGDLVEETRQVGVFDSVRAGTAFEVALVEADSPQVILTVDDNILEDVVAEVDDGTLIIAVRGTVRNPTLRAEVHYSAELEEIAASGATSVTGDDLIETGQMELEASGASTIDVAVATTQLDVEAEGASTVRTSGSAEVLEISADGASTVDASELTAAKAQAEASGASKIEVVATDELDMEASGASTIRHSGSATVLRSQSTGSSTIETM